jgi:hypothetical protein
LEPVASEVYRIEKPKGGVDVALFQVVTDLAVDVLVGTPSTNDFLSRHPAQLRPLPSRRRSYALAKTVENVVQTLV